MSSIASSELSFSGGGRTRPLTVRRMAQARRMRLSVDPRDGAVRLVLPPRAPLRPALQWAEGQRAWIEAALAAIPVAPALAPGSTVIFRGEPHVIDWAEANPRAIRIADGRLHIGGSRESLSPRLLRWLRSQALAELSRLTAHYCALAAVAPGHVGIGDARSRWGSCTSTGDIRFSWRLILAPPSVLEATVAHEVAHRLHMDHSPAFHAAVARLLGREPTAERAWLRQNGAALHGIGQ